MTNEFLYRQIQNFKFDPPGATKTFAKRLAEENKISLKFAEEIIAEYKKFVYLFCIKEEGKRTTPSLWVDQVWHLHLIYTKSYWQGLCKNIIGKELHHSPGFGIPGEDFNNSYNYTLLLYLQEFGEINRKVWLGERGFKRWIEKYFLKH